MFYKNKNMKKDGHLHKCIDCQRIVQIKYRNTNILRIREYDRERSKDKKRILKQTLLCKKYRKQNKLKYKAHTLVKSALRNGSLKKLNCEVCNSEISQAHHDDYTKPLNVRWLCSLHHHEVHKKMRDNLK